MRACRELRQEAWDRATHGWSGRIILVYTVLVLIAVAVICLVRSLAGGDMTTWDQFLQSKAEAELSGLDYAVPSTAAARQMTYATCFSQFLWWLLGGIMSFGIAAVLLKAARRDETRWFGAAFGGFQRPFGVFWLTVLMLLRMCLWSLLLVFPGVIAKYRYSMAWYVKNEHPDWSAGRCLAESGRLMKGYKWRLFVFQCSYAGWILLSLFLTLAPATIVDAHESLPPWVALTAFALMLVGMGFFVFTVIYAALGQAVFYLEIQRPASAPEGEAAK